MLAILGERALRSRGWLPGSGQAAASTIARPAIASPSQADVSILKRGRPIAQVLPAVPREAGYPQSSLNGTVKILGDIIAPVLPARDWEAEDGPS